MVGIISHVSELKNRIPFSFRSEIRSISEFNKIQKKLKHKNRDGTLECIEQP